MALSDEIRLKAQQVANQRASGQATTNQPVTTREQAVAKAKARFANRPQTQQPSTEPEPRTGVAGGFLDSFDPVGLGVGAVKKTYEELRTIGSESKEILEDNTLVGGETSEGETAYRLGGKAIRTRFAPITGLLQSAFSALPEQVQESAADKVGGLLTEIWERGKEKIEEAEAKKERGELRDPLGLDRALPFVDPRTERGQKNLMATLEYGDALGTKGGSAVMSKLDDAVKTGFKKAEKSLLPDGGVSGVFSKRMEIQKAKQAKQALDNATSNYKGAIRTYEELAPTTNRPQTLRKEFEANYGTTVDEELIRNRIPLGVNSDGTRFATLGAAKELVDVTLRKIRAPYKKLLSQYRGVKGSTVSDIFNDTVDKIKSLGLEPEKEAKNILIAKRKAQAIANKYKSDILDIPKSDAVKSGLYKTGYKGGKQVSSQEGQVARLMARSFLESVEREAKDEVLTALNRETSKVLATAGYLRSIDNTTVKGGRLGRGHAKLIGTIATAKMGPFAAITAGELFALLQTYLNNVERLTTSQINTLRNKGFIPSWIETLDDAKQHIKTLKKQAAERPLLAPAKPLLTTKDTSGLLQRRAPGEQIAGQRAQLPQFQLGPGVKKIIPPYDAPTVIEPRAKKVGTADSVFSEVVGSKSYKKLPKTLQDMEKAIAKKVDDFRREADLMVDRKGAGVKERNVVDASGEFRFRAKSFSLPKAKKQMRVRAAENKDEAFKMLMENDPEFRALVKKRNKKLAELPEGNIIDVEDLAFAGIAGVSQDEDGNITFDPRKALMGVAGFSVAKKSGLGKALKGKVDNLAKEAKKFESADEFVEAQGTPVYHGTYGDFKGKPKTFPIYEGEAKIADIPVTFSSKSKSHAKAFGDNVFDLYLYGKKNIINAKGAKIGSWGDAYKLFKDDIKKAYQEGKDYIEVKNIYDLNDKTTKKLQTIYLTISPTKIKTKSQLIDIWNKAHKATPETSLIKEAKKFESADEFVEAQELFSHQTNTKFKDFDLTFAHPDDKAIWFFKGKPPANDLNYKHTKYRYPKKNLKLVKENQLDKLMDSSPDNIDFYEYLSKKGYDGIDYGYAVQIFNTQQSLKTKQQLIDIWKKENK